MEGQDGDPPARCQAVGEQAQKGVERAILVVDGDAKCLEYPADRAVDRLGAVTAGRHRIGHRPGKCRGGRDRCPGLPIDNRARQRIRVLQVRVGFEHPRQPWRID